MEVKTSRLENLLRFPGADPPGGLVSDAAVLSCGCLVSEAQYLAGPKSCPVCFEEASMITPIAPLRELYKLLDPKQRRSSSSRQSLRKSSDSAPTESMDLVGLFCKLAREETEGKREVALSSSPETEMKAPILSPEVPKQPEDDLDNMLSGLNEQEEYNFSRCFPFHRKLTTFQTANNKLKKLSLRSSAARYNGCSLCTRYDKAVGEEITTFVLITDKRWELYTYRPSSGKPSLLACGKSTGEFSYGSSEYKPSSKPGLIVKNEFGGKSTSSDSESVGSKLKSWVHLSCCLSRRFLVLAGTRGVVRVLNADPEYGDVGAPVYTYLTNFPIRCISIAPKENLIACGITARERMSGKQQPFVILHQLDMDQQNVKSVHPITITIPYRDPLKVISFNAASTHIICSTVYEMRYFIIRLRSTPTSVCKKPMLIWSDMRVASRQKLEEMTGDRSYDTNVDDQVMDSEGITDIKFGLPGTNTIAITTASWNNRPSLLVKLEGPSIDAFGGMSNVSLEDDVEDDRNLQITDYDVTLKVPEIGSSIYRVEFSPRGDSILFLDKSGRIFLVSTPNARTTMSQTKKIIVLLGEAANAVRPNEAASVSYSSDGGKIFVVDRRGLFQVFDFTKGIPGEDPEVIKCKIVSV
ncbi:hypothetical protein CA3LBN_004283 [Candidozyma haemuli]|uniref:Uncharacterized protein n=1 Tax=Candidozyma haemuli TaxID=45357 RepID=A0ABX8I9G9_9ASCO|nr:hypothetical protein CA3LBN_004283 [[Candida] haemuloni]